MKINNKLILENSKNLNVLYVEDDEILRKITQELFESFFLHVDIAIDGNDGYKKYQDYYNDTNSYYDIVISDINMPNMNGIDMAKKIKKINNEQAIIFITAFDEVKYLHSAVNIGVSGFLSKPIETQQLNEVLYTISKNITDKKLVSKHYKQIEEHNMLALNLRDARDFSSAKDIVLDIEENKEKISNLWTEKKVVHERLERHTIDVDYFTKHYAMKVLEYFIDVINGDAELGNCPVIFVMLDFFKHKNLPLEDIFMICVLFKNTITAYIFDRYSFNHVLFDDISLILDKNFEGVVINYLSMKKCDKQILVEEIPAEVALHVEAEEVNYAEYVLENDVYELQDLEEDIDNLAISVTGVQSSVEACMELGNKIQRYGNILSNYPLFSELGKYINKLGINFVDNSQLLSNDRERMANISALIEGFVNDLIVWRKEIFENNIENPHFLDNSFFSNVDTIIMFIEYDESAASEEAFDDDMFF